MFEQVADNFRKAAEVNMQMQQEIFKKWVGLWPGFPGSTSSTEEQIKKFQKRWTEVVGEMMQRQREMTEAQFKAGLQNLEKAFQVGEAKSAEELRAKTLDLWRQCFDSLREIYEVQVKDFQTMLAKWIEMTKTAA